MIERGMTPPETHGADRQRRAHGFKMSLGILLCGLGLGSMMLITFAAGEAGTGAGVGGAIVMVGIAFIVSAFFTERQGPTEEVHMMTRRAGMQGARAEPYRPAGSPVDPPPVDPSS